MSKLITCVSYGGTGSSAITDLLKEFKCVDSKGDFEFSFLYEPDGVSDLQHHIVTDFQRLKTDEGIYRFEKLFNRMLNEGYTNFMEHDKGEKILCDYIKNITTVEWEGYWHAHSLRNNSVLGKIKRKINNLKLIFYRKIYSKINNQYLEYAPEFEKNKIVLSNLDEEEFLEHTKKFTDEFLTLFNSDKEILALDQIIPSNNLTRYMKYFSEIKVIVVDRDPRDLYILNKYFWNEGWIPSNDIDIYIKWFKSIRCDRSVDGNILRINFEDLVLNYEKTLTEILIFLNIDNAEHINKKEFFNPDKSIKNLNLWSSYMQKEESNIKEIELKLEEYCYNIDISS